MYNLMTEDQKDLTKLARDILTKELLPIKKECEARGEFPMAAFNALNKAGFNGMAIPEEYGGLGLDMETLFLLEEEMGKIDAGFAFSYCVSRGAAGTILKYGTEEQKKRMCDFVLNGGISALCLTEADAGSALTAIRTTALQDGDDYIINGSKCFISNAPLANIFLVLAYTDKDKGSKGMSFFMVEKERGVQVGKHEDKLGIRLSETSDVIFEDVRVPASNRIGAEGKGYGIALGQVGKARLLTSAAAIGLAQHALNECIEYSKIRKSFGKPINTYQGVSFLLADMEMKIQAARQLGLYGCRQASNNTNFDLAACCCKTFTSDIAVQVATDAIQIFGGYGYSREYPIEQLYRDAKIFQIFEGTNQIQRMIISGMLTA